ncbi:one-helix protein 2 [Perilla frutescens var. frutescens]|nr:one-helix protein 2 [Perilla frutescens var. frutescens]
MKQNQCPHTVHTYQRKNIPPITVVVVGSNIHFPNFGGRHILSEMGMTILPRSTDAMDPSDWESSQADGPLRRPVVPAPVKPSPPAAPPAASPPPKPAAPAAVQDKNVVTLEFQRQKAKELQEYFKQKKLEEVVQGPFFGFIGKNEISNGRWAMFGFAVGMLTEFATGSDFVDQVKILLSNFGILDLE